MMDDVDKVRALMAMVVSSTFEEERRTCAVRAVMLIHEKGLAVVTKEQAALLTPFGDMPVASEEPLRAEPWARDAGWEEKWAAPKNPVRVQTPPPEPIPPGPELDPDGWRMLDRAVHVVAKQSGRCRVCHVKHVVGDTVVKEPGVPGFWCRRCRTVT